MTKKSVKTQYNNTAVVPNDHAFIGGNDQTYFKQLDGLRLLAVTAVMFGHWMRFQIFETLNSALGGFGVNLFFVLSGFLITRILIISKQTSEQQKISPWYLIRQFYIRRSLRIFPIYYLTILISLILQVKLAKDIILWLTTYTTNIYWSMGGMLGMYGHYWSLAVEEQYYLVFPFFILFIPGKYIVKMLYGLIGLALAARIIVYILHPTGVETYVLMPCCLDSFGLGGLLAYWSVFNKEKVRNILQKKWLFIASGLVLFLCCIQMYLFPEGTIFLAVFNRFSVSLVCFWMIGTATHTGFKGRAQSILENKKIIYLGKISYGLYLYHHFMPYIVLSILRFFNVSLPFHRFHSYLYPMLYFLLTLVISAISWRLIESPFNSLKKYFEYK